LRKDVNFLEGFKRKFSDRMIGVRGKGFRARLKDVVVAKKSSSIGSTVLTGRVRN